MRKDLREIKEQVCKSGFILFDLTGKGLFISDAPKHMEESESEDLCKRWIEAGYEVERHSAQIIISPGSWLISQYVHNIEQKLTQRVPCDYLPIRLLQHPRIPITINGKKLIWEALRYQNQKNVAFNSECRIRNICAINMRNGDTSGQYETGLFLLEYEEQKCMARKSSHFGQAVEGKEK